MKKPVRLFWGENYSQKPPRVKTAIKKAVQTATELAHLYPGTLYEETQDLIANTFKLDPKQVLLGHGVEGLVNIICQTFLRPGKAGATFEPSFFVYNNNLDRYPHLYYPCRYYVKVDVGDFLGKIAKTNVFFLASPNTATGNYLFNHAEIETILKYYQGVLVIDECYFGIGDMTVIDLLKKYPRLLILRSLTKTMGLAGLRLGFAVGQAQLIKQLNYHFREIELDPINAFSLQVFKETFPYSEELTKTTNQFFDEFLKFMQANFPETSVIKTLTTFYFMDIRPFHKPAFEIMNYLTKHGYLMSEHILKDNRSIKLPEFIQLTPPPKEMWKDFANTLKAALEVRG